MSTGVDPPRSSARLGGNACRRSRPRRRTPLSQRPGRRPHTSSRLPTPPCGNHLLQAGGIQGPADAGAPIIARPAQVARPQVSARDRGTVARYPVTARRIRAPTDPSPPAAPRVPPLHRRPRARRRAGLLRRSMGGRPRVRKLNAVAHASNAVHVPQLARRARWLRARMSGGDGVGNAGFGGGAAVSPPDGGSSSARRLWSQPAASFSSTSRTYSHGSTSLSRHVPITDLFWRQC